MTNVVPAPRLEKQAAARTEDAVKVYGKGQTEVRALDGVTVEFAAGRYTAGDPAQPPGRQAERAASHRHRMSGP